MCYIMISLVINLRVRIPHDKTVQPVFKGHCDERSPSDVGTLSQNTWLLHVNDYVMMGLICHVGTLLNDGEKFREDRFYCTETIGLIS